MVEGSEGRGVLVGGWVLVFGERDIFSEAGREAALEVCSPNLDLL